MKRKEREYTLINIGVIVGKLCVEFSLSPKTQEKMLEEAYKAFYIWETEMAESDTTYKSYIANILNKKLKGNSSMHEAEYDEHEIKLINHILEEAVNHGGDVGGPYRQNQQKLALAINDWLGYRHLNEKYELHDISRDPNFNGWCELKIAEREWHL